MSKKYALNLLSLRSVLYEAKREGKGREGKGMNWVKIVRKKEIIK